MSQTIIIAPQYDDGRGFSEGLAAVKKDGKWGYVDVLGNVIISPAYIDARSFHEGLAAVKTDKGWGFINKSGEFVIPDKYYEARDYSEGLAGVKIDKTDSQCWKFIDTKGTSPFGRSFEDVASFHEGVACIKTEGKWNFIDKNGKSVNDVSYKTEYPYTMSSGLCPAQGGYMNDCGYKGIDGQWKIKPIYRGVTSFENGIALVEEYGGIYHFINTAGDILSTYQTMPLLLGDNMFYADGNIYKIGEWDLPYFKKNKLYFYSSFQQKRREYDWVNYNINHSFPEFREEAVISEGSPTYDCSRIKVNSKYVPSSVGTPSMGVWFTIFRDISGGSYKQLCGFTALDMKDFISQHVISQMKEWLKKGEYESTSAYENRTSEKNRQQKMAYYASNLINNWLKKGLDQWHLSNYDADHETYALTTDIGQYVIQVDPTIAKLLKDNWQNIEKNVSFAYKDGLTIESFSFTIPNSENLICKIDESLLYDGKDVMVDHSGNNLTINIIEGKSNNSSEGKKNMGKLTSKTIDRSIDQNIPVTKTDNNKMFVLIIGNEKYKRMAEVPYANNDAKVFAEYCQKTLGVPQQNIDVYTDASVNDMRHAVQVLANRLKAFNGDARAIVYYSGHGYPDEATKVPYLMPIDAFASDISTTGYNLNDIYDELAEAPSQLTLFLLDACFSGTTRMGGMAINAKGIAIAARNTVPTGNMMVFSASQGTETAYIDEEHEHGRFTYYILKHLRETKGDTTLGNLVNDVTKSVNQASVIQNDGKTQTPTPNPSFKLGESWKTIKLR